MYDYKQLKPLAPSELYTLRKLLARLLGTSALPAVIPGEAIIGIEAIAAGLAAPGRKVLNVVTGPYGALFGRWLERGGAEVTDMASGFDDVIRVEDVAAAIERERPEVLSFVQAEAVTGGTNPTKELLELARRHNLITVLDSVSAVGAEPVPMEEWGIDFVAIGAQKALAGPNGVSAVGVSARGWALLEANPSAPRGSILSLLDVKPQDDPEAPAPPNIPVLEARALIEALQLAEQEGLASVQRRHRLAAQAARAALVPLGLAPWQRRESGYAPLVTTVRLPQGGGGALERPEGIVAPGDGELRGQLLRINHFGANADIERVAEAVETLARLTGYTGQSAAEAVQAARDVWGGWA